jgi:hypothetical protein
VVRSDGRAGLRLVARSAPEYLHRALAEEDAASSVDAASSSSSSSVASAPSAPRVPGAVAAALAGAPLPFAYTRGAASASASSAGAKRHSALDVYLARAAGKFPDVAQRLVAGHFGAGDETSALVTVDWYSGSDSFKGWASPAAYAAALLARLGRGDEARDAARVALSRGPWWSLDASNDDNADASASASSASSSFLFLPTGYVPMVTLAGFGGRSASDIKAALADGGVVDPSARPAKGTAARAMDAAELLLDSVVAEEAAWADVAAALADAYAQAGRPELSRFVGAQPRG